MEYNYHHISEEIPLHRVALLRPFTQFLNDMGAPVERGLHQAGLTGGALENINNFVPSQRFYTFLSDMAFREGIDELGFRVGRQFGANNVAPHLSDLLQQSPTLYQGLSKALDLANKSVSKSQMGILLSSHDGYAYFYHRPSCDLNNPAIRQISWFGILTLIGMVRVFTGPHWLPSEIGIMTKEEPELLICDYLNSARILLSQPCSYIKVEKALISMPPWKNDVVTKDFPSVPDEPVARDLIGSIKQILHTSINEKDLSLAFLAELCGLSKRNLQRKIKKRGSCYADVLDQVRFEIASQMLLEPDIKVGDVSQQLGYSDPTHFARAFRRIAGVAPREYRANRP